MRKKATDLKEVPSPPQLSMVTEQTQVEIKESSELDSLRREIIRAGNEGVTMPEAEKLAARFLEGLMQLGGPDGMIREYDLDAKMKKNGYKTMRAKKYLEIVQRAEKKPTEAQIEAEILTDATVCATQDAYENAESQAEGLRRTYDIFRDAHVYFRQICKGKFE